MTVEPQMVSSDSAIHARRDAPEVGEHGVEVVAVSHGKQGFEKRPRPALMKMKRKPLAARRSAVLLYLLSTYIFSP